MRIQLKARMAGPAGNYYPAGSVITVDKENAVALVEGGYAVAIDEPATEKEVDGPVMETAAKKTRKKGA